MKSFTLFSILSIVAVSGALPSSYSSSLNDPLLSSLGLGSMNMGGMGMGMGMNPMGGMYGGIPPPMPPPGMSPYGMNGMGYGMGGMGGMGGMNGMYGGGMSPYGAAMSFPPFMGMGMNGKK